MHIRDYEAVDHFIVVIYSFMTGFCRKIPCFATSKDDNKLQLQLWFHAVAMQLYGWSIAVAVIAMIQEPHDVCTKFLLLTVQQII